MDTRNDFILLMFVKYTFKILEKCYKIEIGL